jgi:ATP-dependent Clp protease ATP-binding subunit ClpX
MGALCLHPRFPNLNLNHNPSLHMTRPPESLYSEELLKDLTHYLSQMGWVPDKDTLFRQGEKIVFRIDLSGLSHDIGAVAHRLQHDPSLLELVTQYAVRLYMDPFRAVTLTLAGNDLQRIHPTAVCLDGSHLRFTISPGTVCMMNRQYYRWSKFELDEPERKERDSLENHPIARMQKRIEAIPQLTPHEMNLELEKRGYCGQENARRAVCLFAYRHLRRIHALFVEGVPLSQLPPKENLLLQGPTGCGKTYLLEILFREILELPVAIVDVSSITEAGYAGQSSEMIPQQLIQAAGGDLELASIGVICLDEFDKLAGNAEHGRDVNGFGVQRELLKMIEGSELPPSWRERRSSGKTFSTRCVPFVAAGAFSRMGKLKASVKRRQNPIGFTGEASGSQSASIPGTDLLQRYGFMPELVGRFGRFAEVDPMSPELMEEILDQQVIQRYQAECEREGVGLHISAAVRRELVNHGLQSGTGARGLATSLNTHMEEACYRAFSSTSAKMEIHFRLDRGEITYRLREEKPSQDTQAMPITETGES